MASDYYDNSDVSQRLQPGTTARSEEIESKFDRVATGFEMAEQDIDRSIKLPAGPDDQELDASALQRRNRVVGFDHDGNLALLTGFNWRGDWAPSTEYFINDVVKTPSSGNWYVATVRHVSGSSFSAATNWSLGIDYAALRQLLESNLTGDLQPLVDAASQSAQKAAADRVATGQDRTAASQSAQAAEGSAGAASSNAQQTADDRVATGQDRSAASASAQAAAGSASEASDSHQGADAALADFLRRYLGPSGTPPATDNDGNPLTVGALYLSTKAGEEGMRYWSGSAWREAYTVIDGVTSVAGYDGVVTVAQLIMALNAVEGLDADLFQGLSPSKFLRTDQTDQRVLGGFYVDGAKFYFGAGKQHNLFDNDGHGNGGLRLNMDGDVVTGSAPGAIYAFELEMNEVLGQVDLAVFESDGEGTLATNPTKLSLLHAGHLLWDQNKVIHEGFTSLPRYDLRALEVTTGLDLAVQQVFRVIANVDRTLSFVNAPASNRAMTVVVNVYGNVGTVTWPAGVTWNDGVAPELRTGRTTVTLLYDGANWSGSVSGGAD